MRCFRVCWCCSCKTHLCHVQTTPLHKSTPLCILHYERNSGSCREQKSLCASTKAHLSINRVLHCAQITRDCRFSCLTVLRYLKYMRILFRQLLLLSCFRLKLCNFARLCNERWNIARRKISIYMEKWLCCYNV